MKNKFFYSTTTEGKILEGVVTAVILVPTLVLGAFVLAGRASKKGLEKVNEFHTIVTTQIEILTSVKK